MISVARYVSLKPTVWSFQKRRWAGLRPMPTNDYFSDSSMLAWHLRPYIPISVVLLWCEPINRQVGVKPMAAISVTPVRWCGVQDIVISAAPGGRCEVHDGVISVASVSWFEPHNRVYGYFNGTGCGFSDPICGLETHHDSRYLSEPLRPYEMLVWGPSWQVVFLYHKRYFYDASSKLTTTTKYFSAPLRRCNTYVRSQLRHKVTWCNKHTFTTKTPAI